MRVRLVRALDLEVGVRVRLVRALDLEVGARVRLVRALDLEVGVRVRVEGRTEGRERDERFERLTLLFFLEELRLLVALLREERLREGREVLTREPALRERLAEGRRRASSVVSARAETSGTNIKQTAKNSTKERLIVHLLVSGTELPDGGSGIPFNKNIFERPKLIQHYFRSWIPRRKSW